MSCEANGILIEAVNIEGLSRIWIQNEREVQGNNHCEGVLDHPTHSPDLAPSDFLSFLHLKTHLVGQKFHEDEEANNEVTAWLRAQAAEFYDIGVPKTRTQAKQMPWQRW
jgi:hypothetical protein